MDALIEQLERLELPHHSQRIHTLEGAPLRLSDLLLAGDGNAGDGGLLLHLYNYTNTVLWLLGIR